MTGKELYDIWAPPDRVWSRWVAPPLFAQAECADFVRGEPPCLVPEQTGVPTFSWSNAAVVIDLWGARAFRAAMSLVEQYGFQPVPVINSSPIPPGVTGVGSAIDMRELLEELCMATPRLKSAATPQNAPPVFILDARRTIGESSADVGTYDNRWFVFPHDLPSGEFLLGHGISKIIVIREELPSIPQDDLAEVLIQWQDKGLRIHRFNGENGALNPITVRRPPLYKRVWHLILALAGIRKPLRGFGAYRPGGWAG